VFAHLRSAAVLAALLVPGFAGAEVKIAHKDRIRNRPPGRCGWCALETLARNQHIRALYGLTGQHPSRWSELEDVEELLQQKHVRYHIQYPGQHSTIILRAALHNGRGVAVGLWNYRPRQGGHVVTLVDWGPRTVRIIDSNDRALRVHTISRKYFLAKWDGLALVLDGKKPPKKKRYAAKIPR
jgi:hypothetical protein